MGTMGRSACGRVVMMGQVILWSTRSSLLKAKSKPSSSPARNSYAGGECGCRRHVRRQARVASTSREVEKKAQVSRLWDIDPGTLTRTVCSGGLHEEGSWVRHVPCARELRLFRVLCCGDSVHYL